MPYIANISRSNPILFVFLLDQSGSMAGTFGGTESGITKAQGIADTINSLLSNLVIRGSVGNQVLDYFEVAVLGYWGMQSVMPAFSGQLAGKEIIRISEIAAYPSRLENRTVKLPDGAGVIIDTPTKFPVWIEPRAENDTPMGKAFEHAFALIEKWIKNHPTSFPPIVINITDGQPNDPIRTRYAAEKIMNLETSDGKVLLFNAHITGLVTSEIQLPFRNSEISDSYANFLFEISSIIPHRLLQEARQIGLSPQSDSRGLIFNASVETLVKFLEISTYPREFYKSDSSSQKRTELREIPPINTKNRPLIDDIPVPILRHSNIDNRHAYLSDDFPQPNVPKYFDEKFRISISHPKRFSKRYSSLFLIQIYFPKMRSRVHQAITSEFVRQKITEHVRKSELGKGQIIRLKLSCPGVSFSDPVNKKLDKNINIANFTAKPDDNCEPGVHQAILYISDPATGIEYQSINFYIQITDFAFDHISRPFLSKVLSALLGIGSLIMFILTFLGQIDSTFGLTSGTVAGTLASAIYVQFFSLYKYARTSTAP